MRKETIIKFEKEFMAWCKGKSVLKGAPISMSNRELYWEEVKDFADWKALDTVYILNDSYSTYRKAIAEGKTIQVNNLFDESWTDIKDVKFTGNIKMYRIKPEEHQFKEGDWCTHKNANGPFQWCKNDTDFENIEHWKPKPGEWCWVSTNGTYSLYQYNNTSRSTHDLEPFIGTLPAHLKD